MGVGNWPDARAPTIDFIATLPTAGLHLQRLQSSRQIEKPLDRVQSVANLRRVMLAR
jgi:hypothetical protein